MVIPEWSVEMVKAYNAKLSNSFIIYGNIKDEFPFHNNESIDLKTYMTNVCFAKRDSVIYYDLASGIHFPFSTAGQKMREDFQRTMKSIDSVLGTNYFSSIPREPSKALPLIERYIQTRLMGSYGQTEEKDKKSFSITVIIDYLNFITPAAGDIDLDEASCLITIQKWAKNPLFKEGNCAFIMISESLSDIHQSLARSPDIFKIKANLPNKEERLENVKLLNKFDEEKSNRIAELTSGLSNSNIKQLINQATANGVEAESALFEIKKRIIERESGGLLEFIQTKYSLDNISGHVEAKKWLQNDANLLKEGKLDAVPQGYLICGPVGTGKTFLMSCYAGTLGIPCVKILNFRSKWQGDTEANWERILNTLKLIGPVAVIIDEADAALGDRDNSGDSGTGSRVFSMLAQLMGDTAYRGKILWFLLTCRPDLLPIDLKRQGRAEVHIPLFYPSESERSEYFNVLAKKNGIEISFDFNSILPKEVVENHVLNGASYVARPRLSGADIESILIRAKRNSLVSGRKEVLEEDLKEAILEFTPSNNALMIELQVQAAIVESTNRRFIPEWLNSDKNQAMKMFGWLKEELGER